MESRQKGIDDLRKACVACGQEFPGSLEVCPEDGTLLTPIGKEPKVGDNFADRYEILGIIGDGGMGKVYKARHNLMKRVVAIKMLLPHLVQSAAALKRFQQEAQAASALNHPNILTVYDFGISDQGMPFLVMDYLEGTSLAALLQEQGALSEERSIHIFSQACSALAHAHQKGVIHRDLKPANIMLIDYDGQTDFLKIVDFGIAKLLQPDGAEQLTHTGEVFGSPLYMSPEQCRGRELDPRSDIYSLGCVLYRTVTGKPVFAGRDPMECMYKQVNDLPSSFSTIVPELCLSDKLEAAIFRAIAKEADDRYNNMMEFREALENCREHRSGSGNRVFAVPLDSPDAIPQDFLTDQMKRPNLASTQLSNHSSDTVDAIVAAASSGKHKAAQAADSAPAMNSTSLPPEADGGSAASSSTASIPASSSMSASGSAIASEPVEAASGPNNLSLAEASLTGSNSTVSNTDNVARDDSASGPITQSNQALGSLPSEQAVSGSTAAIGGNTEAISGAQNAQPTNEAKALAKDSAASQIGSSSSGAGSSAVSGNKTFLIGGGIAAAAVVVGLIAFSMNNKKPEIAATHDLTPVQEQKADVAKMVNQAKSQIEQEDIQSSEKTLRDAMEAASAQKDSVAKQEEVLPLLAEVYRQSDKFALAQASYQKLLELQKASNESPTVMALTKTDIALAMLEQGNYDDAEPLLQEAQTTLKGNPEGQRKGLSDVLYGLSKIAVGRGDYASAINNLQQAVAIKTSQGAAGNADLAQYLQDLAEIYLLQNRLPLAQQTLDKVLAVCMKSFGSDSPQVADAYKDMATLYFQKGQLQKSEAYFDKSLAIKSKAFGPQSVSAAEIMTAKAMLYTRQQKFKQADALFRQAIDIRTRELGADSPQAKRTRELYAKLQQRMKGSR